VLLFVTRLACALTVAAGRRAYRVAAESLSRAGRRVWNRGPRPVCDMAG
jgi:hypothetical protein